MVVPAFVATFCDLRVDRCNSLSGACGCVGSALVVVLIDAGASLLGAFDAAPPIHSFRFFHPLGTIGY